MRAQEIADRFNISLRTVYRDIRALEEAGIPVIGEAGQGYSLVEGYRLPPVMFNKEEALAFITAEKLVEKLTDSSTSECFRSAMFKVRAVLRTVERDLLEGIDSHIQVLRTKGQEKNTVDSGFIQTILKSIADKKAVIIKYFTNYRQENTERCIEPVGVFFLDSYWHLFAFCKMRNDYRDFRLDRILNLQLTDISFEKQHPALHSYLEKVYECHDLHEVVIRVERKYHRFLEGQKYYNGFVSEEVKQDDVEMNFLTMSLEGFARWYLTFGDKAHIVKPESLKERANSILNDTLLNLIVETV